MPSTLIRDGFAMIDPGWATVLRPVQGELDRIALELDARRAAGERVLPRAEAVMAAFRAPFERVRVLIVGQDPYPTPGHAIGLAFAVEQHVRPVPASLRNIHTELRSDLGIETPAHGDLTAWAEQGVLLLNRVLTVRAGAPGSHRGLGWEAVTDAAVRSLVARGGALVAILWGRQAQQLRPLLGSTPVIESAHPSPLSARTGFFGSRPFSRTNAALELQGAPPIDWTIADRH